jgi:hypothetical protein
MADGDRTYQITIDAENNIRTLDSVGSEGGLTPVPIGDWHSQTIVANGVAVHVLVIGRKETSETVFNPPSPPVRA